MEVFFLLQMILGFVIIIMIISLYASFQAMARPNKNILLGISLPSDYAKSSEIMEIIRPYKKMNRVLLIFFCITAAPIFFISYTSIIILYFTVWYGLYMAVSNHYMKIYNRKLLLLKSRNLWFHDDSMYHVLTDVKLQAWFKKHGLLLDDKEQVYVDDDKYWLKGYYHNPFDKRTMVDKRFGVGTSLNMAAKGGKVFAIGISAFTIIMIGGIFLLFVLMDFSTFHLTINDGTVNIQAPMYGYQFHTDEMTQIILTDSMPQKGIRTNGASTNTYMLGNFNFTGYGKAKVYVYKDYSPYIMIKLKDLIVFFNSKSGDKTKEYYEMLTEELKD